MVTHVRHGAAQRRIQAKDKSRGMATRLSTISGIRFCSRESHAIYAHIIMVCKIKIRSILLKMKSPRPPRPLSVVQPSTLGQDNYLCQIGSAGPGSAAVRSERLRRGVGILHLH